MSFKRLLTSRLYTIIATQTIDYFHFVLPALYLKKTYSPDPKLLFLRPMARIPDITAHLIAFDLSAEQLLCLETKTAREYLSYLSADVHNQPHLW